ncbi:hypothetical protein FOA52_000860 [Chlamydomonas sp. UWO 241]|nr:hypothetical protein FOA52_000860 [Chlamydomonas sp. UWO 241]
MASATIAPRTVFGFRGDVSDNIGYTDEGAIVYPAGHNVVLYSPDTKTQRLIPGTLESEGITAICVSSNKRLLAVAERAEKAMITVYDLQTLKRRKVLVSADAGSKEYVSLSFSADGKMLLAQGGGPEFNLVLWVWEKSKVAAVTKATNQQQAPVHSCAFAPGDGSVASVVGTGIFKMFKASEGSLKLLNVALGKRDPATILSQCWVPSDGSDAKERLLLGTTDGEVVMLEGTDARSMFSTDNSLPVVSITCYSKGFVVGQDDGVVTIFEKDEKEVYRRARSFTIEANQCKIKYLAISPSEEYLLCSLENNQIYSLLLSNQEIMKADEMNFDIMGTANHQGPITGMDICIRKPLIATVSTDKSVRLWNYADRTCELVKHFPDEIYSVAIHPTGLQVLVGFADKLRLMTVLMDELKTVKELGVKGCRECCFSTGGEYFAAVNGTTISIYSTYTCENLGNLRGHNGKVRSLFWSPDDSRIISAGTDGAVYEWRLKDFKREKENVLKGCSYSSVISTPDGKTLYAAGSDRKIKEFEEAPGAGTQITKEIDAGTNLTQICHLPNAKVMFAATESGALRTYKYPLTGEFLEIKSHNSSISRMCMSWDEQLLVTASDDGCVFVYDVKDRDAKAAARREAERLEWSAEVLVTRSELDEKKVRMSELEQQVAELTMQTEYQLRLKDLHLQERIKELTEKFTVELETDRQKFELLLAEKNEQEMEYEEKLKASEERSQQQLTTLDTQYQAKIMAEVERFQSLTQEKELLNERWDEQNSLLVESHERVIAELTEDYESKLAEEALRVEQLMQDKAQLEREFEEIKRQLEEDADREIEELKERYESKLSVEKDASLRLKGENGIMRKKFNALQKDIEAQKEEIKNLFEQKRELYATIASLEKDIASLKREIRERDETIGDKERRIYDLKKKNQELEKFKFVLDYKIKELKKQIEPREQEIADMKEQIREMDGELERYHKTNSGLDLMIANLKLKVDGLQQEVLSQRSGKGDAEQMVRRMQHDLEGVVPHIQEPKALKEAVKGLYHKYCGTATARAEADGDLEREATRQREYLERTVDSLKRKLAKDSELHRSDNLRVMQENTALIREINELRREIRGLKARVAGGTPASLGGPPGGFNGAAANAAGSRASPMGPGGQGGRAGSPMLGGSHATMGDTGGLSDGLRKELEMQRELISRMREDTGAKDARIRQLESLVAPRPTSRERLPPMDGFATSVSAPEKNGPSLLSQASGLSQREGGLMSHPLPPARDAGEAVGESGTFAGSRTESAALGDAGADGGAAPAPADDDDAAEGAADADAGAAPDAADDVADAAAAGAGAGAAPGADAAAAPGDGADADAAAAPSESGEATSSVPEAAMAEGEAAGETETEADGEGEGAPSLGGHASGDEAAAALEAMPGLESAASFGAAEVHAAA